jgi:hypothetical protein
MKTCPFCLAEVQPAARKCRHCGEWVDPAVAPEVGAPLPAVLAAADPAAGIQDLPVPSAGPVPTEGCPHCHARWEIGAVLCLVCGFDKRTGRRLQTVRGGPASGERTVASVVGRTSAQLDVSAQHAHLGLVRLGLGFHLARLGLLLLSLLLALALGFLAARFPRPGEGPGFGGVLVSLALLIAVGLHVVLGLVGSILCAWAPLGAGVRAVLIVSLVLDLAAIPAGATLFLLDLPPSLAGLLGLPSWALFLVFLHNLANYLDRGEQAREAMRILMHGLALLVLSPLLVLLPIIWLPGLIELPQQFWGYWLWVMLGPLLWIVYLAKVLFSLLGLIRHLRSLL